MAVTKPDYVLNFAKPPGTEIKHISGHWYLYERKTKYDPVTKRSHRVRGTYLGAITENGFVPKGGRNKAGPAQDGTPTTEVAPPESGATGSSIPGAAPPTPQETGFTRCSGDQNSYTVEDLKARGCYTPSSADAPPGNPLDADSVNFLYHITGRIREVLKRFFSDCWATIYTIAILQVIYGSPFSKLEYHYRSSELSHLYPGIDLSEDRLTEFNRYLGLSRNAISGCMRDLGKGARQYLLVDCHRTIGNGRNHGQINLMYLVSKDDAGVGHPCYYRQYKRRCPDLSAISDLVGEVKDDFDDIIIVGDKGPKNEQICDNIAKENLNYVFGLKRGSPDVAEKINDSRTQFGTGFIDHGRAVQYIVIENSGHNKIVYLDYRLLYEETSSSPRLNMRRIQEKLHETEANINKFEKNLEKAQNAQKQFEKQVEEKKSAFRKLVEIRNKAEIRTKEAEVLAERLSGKHTRQAEKAMITATKRHKYLQKLEMDLAERQAALNADEKSRADAIEEAAFLQISIEDAKDTLIHLQEQAETLANDAALQQSKEYQSSGIPAELEPAITPSLETGTFTVMTSLTDMSPESVYLIYKQQAAIEQFFQFYDSAPGFNYTRDTYTDEGWLFLNHISALMTVLAMEQLKLICS